HLRTFSSPAPTPLPLYTLSLHDALPISFPSQTMTLFAHGPSRPGGGAMYISAWFEETDESSEKNTLLERLSLGPRVALHFQNASWRGAASRTSKIPSITWSRSNELRIVTTLFRPSGTI